MDNIQSSLITCPRCKALQDEGRLGSNKLDAITMGSITSEGYVIVRRSAGKMTMVMTDTYSLICDCGYYIRVNCGKIVADSAFSGTYING